VAAVALTVSYNYCINGAPMPSRSLCHLMSIIIVCVCVYIYIYIYIYIQWEKDFDGLLLIITTVEAFGLWVFRIHNDEGGCM
jgi:hypothetical protein